MKNRFWIIAIAAITLFSVALVWRAWHRERTSLADEKAAFVLSADELVLAFETNENAAGKKFADRIIEVTGTLEMIDTSAAQTGVLLQTARAGKVNCLLQAGQRPPAAALHRPMRLKGRCAGFLMDVTLYDCVLL